VGRRLETGRAREPSIDIGRSSGPDVNHPLLAVSEQGACLSTAQVYIVLCVIWELDDALDGNHDEKPQRP